MAAAAAALKCATNQTQNESGQPAVIAEGKLALANDPWQPQQVAAAATKSRRGQCSRRRPEGIRRYWGGRGDHAQAPSRDAARVSG